MKEILNEWRGFVNESGLSRIYKHIQEHDCIVITAFRGDTNDDSKCTDKAVVGGDNMERNRDLKATLLGLGYGVTKVDGSYIEDFETPLAKEVKENSLFCVNLNDDADFVERLASLSEKFCQDSIIVFPKGGKGAHLMGTNNAEFPGYGKKSMQGDLSMGQEAEFMTRVNNRPFTTKEGIELETYKKLPRLQRMAVRSIQKKILG
ncbi:hypothetical protein N9989_00415 [bacterium]|nr:hypothetical protein [bacterium]